MLSRLRSHVRHNVVGYLALFFALTGVAYAAGPLKPGDPAGGDLTGTYPDPTIAAGAVTGGSGGKVADNSVTGADILESSLGKVGDADTLDSFDSADYGAVMMGRINGLSDGTDPTDGLANIDLDFGPATGVSTASATQSGTATPLPLHDLKIRDLVVRFTSSPGGVDPNTGEGALRRFRLVVNGAPEFTCEVDNDSELVCTDSGPIEVFAGDEMFVAVETETSPPDFPPAAPADVLFGFRLTP